MLYVLFIFPPLRPLKAWFGPNLHKIYPNIRTLRNFARKLSNFATVKKPDDPNSVLTSSGNRLGHVTTKGLTKVKIFTVK